MPTIKRRRKGAASAPAGPADPIEVERRINEIEDRIVSSMWVPGVTPRELAEKWGVEAATVLGYYTEARRGLVRAKRQHGHVFEQRLETMITAAMSKGDVAVAMKGLQMLKDWRTERRILSGRSTAGGVPVGDLAREAAEKNMRDD